MIRNLFIVTCAASSLCAAEVRLTILNESSSEPTPGRIHLRDAAGKAQRPSGYPFWRDHFLCDGNAQVQLEPGHYFYTVEHGPEFSAAKGEFSLLNEATNIPIRLKRVADLAGEGYWSGETHVHRELQDVELLMRAE